MDDLVTLAIASPEDAAALLKIHAAAVHVTAAPYYPDNIIQSWSRLSFTPERVEKVRQRWIEDPSQYTVVAKVGDRMAGFGFIGKNCELRALYVHPDFGRRGIGHQIMCRLEQQARVWGLPYLTAHASLNAEAFYKKQGFEVLGYGTYQLASGQKMDCVNIRKQLVVPTPGESLGDEAASAP